MLALLKAFFGIGCDVSCCPQIPRLSLYLHMKQAGVVGSVALYSLNNPSVLDPHLGRPSSAAYLPSCLVLSARLDGVSIPGFGEMPPMKERVDRPLLSSASAGFRSDADAGEHGAAPSHQARHQSDQRLTMTMPSFFLLRCCSLDGALQGFLRRLGEAAAASAAGRW